MVIFILCCVWLVNSYLVMRKIKIDAAMICKTTSDKVELDRLDYIMIAAMSVLGPFGLFCIYVGSFIHFKVWK